MGGAALWRFPQRGGFRGGVFAGPAQAHCSRSTAQARRRHLELVALLRPTTQLRCWAYGFSAQISGLKGGAGAKPLLVATYEQVKPG